MLGHGHMPWISLLMLGFISKSRGLSMDQIISNATNDVNSFDFFSDNEGTVVRQELDMMLLKEQHDALAGETGKGRKKRKAIRNKRYRWPQNTIPYHITGAFSQSDVNIIQGAMREWQNLTCIQFRRKTRNERDFINFDNGNGCYSYVGKVGGSQTIGLAVGCRYHGVVVHEIGHAVGFHHEQNRPDRDSHVRILKRNIPSNVYYNFKKYSADAVNTYGVPYDYNSVMHYGGKAFSYTGGYTIETINQQYQSVIGNREGLSFHDVQLANRMYKCDASCRGANKCPEYAYRGKDCECYCKSKSKDSPVKVCDGTGSGTTPKPTVVVVTTPKPECIDHYESCPSWADSPHDYCRINTHVKSYCKKSCNLCGIDEETKCTNKKSEAACLGWAHLGYCTKNYVEYMRENCQLTCDRCGDVKGGDAGGVEAESNGVALTFHQLFILPSVLIISRKLL